MKSDFLNAFHSEWLKKKRSLASWLILIGAFFTPTIIIVVRIIHYELLPQLYSQPGFWTSLWRNSWESMAIFFLPMAAILVASLVTQLEYKNNTWKQIHTLPLSRSTLYFSKLAVLVLMMLQFLLLFNAGIMLSGLVPYLLVRELPLPDIASLRPLLMQNALYFIDCLPIVAAQYALGLRFKNFLVPIGFGFLAWVGALAAMSSPYGYALPYAYSMLDYLKDAATHRPAMPTVDIHIYALAYCLTLTIAGHWLFVNKAHKG